MKSLSFLATLTMIIGSIAASQDDGVSANQSHTLDALESTKGVCDERLNFTQFELERQLDYFSRRLDVRYFDNAMKIYQNLTENHGYTG